MARWPVWSRVSPATWAPASGPERTAPDRPDAVPCPCDSLIAAATLAPLLASPRASLTEAHPGGCRNVPERGRDDRPADRALFHRLLRPRLRPWDDPATDRHR